jgi:hypothetical protein
MSRWMKSRWAKVAIGLTASLAAALLYHWPLGGGERFIASLETQAQAHVDWAGRNGLPGLSVRMQRRPLARIAILSGRANAFQREGTSTDPEVHLETDYPGMNDRMRSIPGIAGVRWEE